MGAAVVANIEFILAQLTHIIALPVTATVESASHGTVRRLGSHPAAAKLLRKLEVQLVRHAWENIKRRYEEGRDAFVQLMVDVLGPPVPAGGFSKAHSKHSSRRLLSTLRSPKHREVLLKIDKFVRHTDIAFKSGRDDPQAVELASSVLTVLYDDIKFLIDAWDEDPDDPTTLFALCTCSAYLKTKPNEAVLDMAWWMAHCVAPKVRCNRIVRMVDSGWLAPFLAQGIRVVAVPSTARPFDLKLTHETLKQAADAARRRAEASASDTVSEDVGLDKFLDSVGTYVPYLCDDSQVAVADNSVECFKKRVDVHCECALLAHLHARLFVPYIGISKLTCSVCHLYMAAYTKTTDVPIATRGFHSYPIGLWVLPPAVGADVDGTVRRTVEGKVQEQLFQRLHGYLRRREANLARSRGQR
ncbi:hypothetical protein OF83DRAFT_1288388 [Amylostereum chailletii]|nr:hypothetical protein OF83DRAFT_1288388 [Amylostereum chailletii]